MACCWLGGVVGVFHFLLGYMGYKNLFYIGFDGGIGYGAKVYSSKKDIMQQHAAEGYKKSWEDMLRLSGYYPGVIIQPLEEFINESTTSF